MAGDMVNPQKNTALLVKYIDKQVRNRIDSLRGCANGKYNKAMVYATQTTGPSSLYCWWTRQWKAHLCFWFGIPSSWFYTLFGGREMAGDMVNPQKTQFFLSSILTNKSATAYTLYGAVQMGNTKTNLKKFMHFQKTKISNHIMIIYF